MIPANARSLFDLHMSNAIRSESDTFAAESLAAAEAMLGYALAVDHITPAEYTAEIVLTKLARAQRKTRAASRS